MPSGVCALTGQYGTFVDCHLYPRSFYKDTSDATVLKLMSAGGPYKRSPIGVYDNMLVVDETEKWFAKLDNGAFNFLKPYEALLDLHRRASRNIGDETGIFGVEFDDFDFQGLSLFFYSVLWRFAASKRPEASAATLGPYEEPLRKILLTRHVPDDSPFGIIVSKLSDGDRVPLVMPARQKTDGINTMNMLFGGFEVLIKTDRRQYASALDILEMKPDRPLAILIRDYKSSRAYGKMVQMARDNYAKFGNPWKGGRKEL